MPKPIVCLSEQLSQYLEAFRGCFSTRQWKYFVTVLLGLIECDGRGFGASADLSHVELASMAELSRLCSLIEDCAKPVVAVIPARALGAGLELALAAHYRIIAPSAVVGLPDIKLGLLPGAGGTQRLPRLTGAEAALEMMISGKPISGVRALEMNIVDRDINIPNNLYLEAILAFREVTKKILHLGKGWAFTKEFPPG